MAAETTIRFRWTLEEITEAARSHLRQSKAFRVRLAICFALAAVCMLIALVSRLRTGDFWPCFGFVLAGLYFVLLFVFARWFSLWRIRRSAARSTSFNQEVEWRIAENMLHVKQIHGSSETAWSLFNKAVRTPKGLLLYSQPIIFHWLPRHAFVNAVDFEAVAALARSHIAVFRQLS